MNGNFGYGEKDDPPQPLPANTTVLNALIYEYLIKKNYLGTAKVFKIEGDVNGIHITNGTSALLDWFAAFSDIYGVRSGRGGASGIVSKIDTILGKTRPQEQEFSRREFGQKKSFQERRIPRSTSAEHLRYEREEDILNTILGIPEEEPFQGGVAGSPQMRGGISAMKGAAPRKPQAPSQRKDFHPKDKDSLFINELAHLRLHSQKVTSLCVCREKKILITGGADAAICIVDLSTFTHFLRFEAHQMQVSQIKVKEAPTSGSEDAPTVFGSASLDGEVKVYQLRRREGKWDLSVLLVLKGHGCSVRGMDFGESRIFSMGIDGELRVWSMEGLCLSIFSLKRTIRMISSISDKLLVISDVSSLFLFDAESGACIREIAPRGSICSYKMKSGSLFVFSDAVSLYDPSFSLVESVPFPADKIQSACYLCGRVVLGGYQTIYEWFDKKLSIMHAHENIVTCLDAAEISGNNLLISASYDGDVKIWEQPLS
jgi:WD40 repeat protein